MVDHIVTLKPQSLRRIADLLEEWELAVTTDQATRCRQKIQKLFFPKK